MKKGNTDCPICNGTGKIDNPRIMQLDTTDVRRMMALKLHEKGYSLRQIQKAIGYKSVRSVHLIITDHGKKRA